MTACATCALGSYAGAPGLSACEPCAVCFSVSLGPLAPLWPNSLDPLMRATGGDLLGGYWRGKHLPDVRGGNGGPQPRQHDVHTMPLRQRRGQRAHRLLEVWRQHVLGGGGRLPGVQRRGDCGCGGFGLHDLRAPVRPNHRRRLRPLRPWLLLPSHALWVPHLLQMHRRKVCRLRRRDLLAGLPAVPGLYGSLFSSSLWLPL